MKKILTCAILTLTVLGLGGMAVADAQACGNGFYSNGFHSIVIDKLVERFNLNADEVQEVFDEARDEMMEEMSARWKEKWANWWTCSDLTDEQKETLAAKREELQAEYEALKDLSWEERWTKMKELREELEVWAEENEIDLRCLGGFPGYGFNWRPRGFGWGFGHSFFKPGQK